MAKSPPPGSELSAEELAGIGGDDVKDTLAKAAEALGGRVVGGVTPREKEDKEKQELPAGVEEEDRREYIRTMLAGEPFIKEYSLFGDTVVAKFRSRTVKEANTIDSRHPDDDVAAERMALILSTVQVHFKGKEAKQPSTDVYDQDFYSEFPEMAFLAILRAFREFESICDVLFERANDINFWNPTGGRS